MEYHFNVMKDGEGFWAKCIELKGCVTQSDSYGELLGNAIEALACYLDEPDGSVTFPLPMNVPCSDDVVAVKLDPEVAFALMLRRQRLEHHLTQREVAERLGMRNVYSYQRLERRSNPTLSLLNKIRTVFPDLSIDALS